MLLFGTFLLQVCIFEPVLKIRRISQALEPIVWGYLFLLALQLLLQGLFLVYNRSTIPNLSPAIVGQIIYHGLGLRSSIAAYGTILVGLIVLVGSFVRSNSWQRILTGYMVFLSFFLPLLEVLNVEMYRAWGSHIHATVFLFLAHPTEAAASVSSSPWLLGIVLWLGFSLFGTWVWRRYFAPALAQNTPLVWLQSPLVLLATAFLIIPIRGGLQLSPISQSSAFFSPDYATNQAALSPTWNLMHSITEFAANDNDKYVFMSAAKADSLLAILHPRTPQEPQPSFIKARRPNVVLVIWESLTAKMVGSLNGQLPSTPCFDAITKEGILFTQAYSSGDRSEKGLLTLMTGYPAQPTVSAIIFPDVTNSLPHLPENFKKAGYNTSFVYGGELGYANLKSMLQNCEFDSLTDIESFAKKDLNSKWGAHDEVTFAYLQRHLATKPQPWFATIYTLSSHEPFEMPGQPNHAEWPEERRFARSMRYADSCLGAFIAGAKKTTWWDSTIVCIVADHGHRMPGNSPAPDPAKYYIPILITGGAVAARNQKATMLCSQGDVPPLLEHLAGLPSQGSYPYARNPLSASYSPRAFYTFNDGIGLMQPSNHVVVDCQNKKTITAKGTNLARTNQMARALIQQSTRVMER